MSYRLQTDETPADGIRRIARERLEKALREIEKLSTTRAAAAVHATRKHIKKLRALLRLVCDEIGEEIFAEENRRLRDVARRLSGARDGEVQLRVFEKLGEGAGQKKAAFPATRATLKRDIAALSVDLAAEKQAAETTLQWIGDRIDGWPLENLSTATLCSSLKRFYRRGRKALRFAESDPTADNFHSWRKRVKDFWYQALLLQNLNRAVLCEIANAVQTLGRHLGDLHDLAFFRSRLTDDAGLPESERTILLRLICAREEELRVIALDLGARFFAEKPKAFEKRLLRYAKEWPRSGSA